MAPNAGTHHFVGVLEGKVGRVSRSLPVSGAGGGRAGVFSVNFLVETPNPRDNADGRGGFVIVKLGNDVGRSLRDRSLLSNST